MPETQTPVKTSCYHCGDECQTTAYQTDLRQFCCQGCQRVYTILSGAGLSSYYQYNDHPGTTRTRNDKRFDYLSDPSVQAELLDY